MSGRVVEFAYAAGWRLVRVLPERVAWAVFRTVADAAYLRRGRAVRRLDANLRRVVGSDVPDADLDALVRAGMRSYARYWLEAFRLPTYSREQLRRGFRLVDPAPLTTALADGRGAVVALPHAGNWDAAGAWLVAHGWPLTTVAERLRPEGLYTRFLAYRRGLGMDIVPLHGGQRPPLQLLEERLGEGHVVALLADRDLSTRGVEVDFFGGRTRMPPGPALLALRTGAPLFAVTMWYEEDAAVGELHGPLALPTDGPLDQRVRTVTQQLADVFASGIAAHPADWHMLQRVWLPGQPDGDAGTGDVSTGDAGTGEGPPAERS